MQRILTCGELGVEELQELELDSKALLGSGGCDARGRLGLPSRPFMRCRFEKDFEGKIKKPSCAPSKSLTARPAARRRGEPGKAGSMWLFNVHSEDNGNGSAHS